MEAQEFLKWIEAQGKMEALQNFADKICEKQREICADVAEIGSMNGKPYVKYNSILNAEQPEIEEL